MFIIVNAKRDDVNGPLGFFVCTTVFLILISEREKNTLFKRIFHGYSKLSIIAHKAGSIAGVSSAEGNAMRYRMR